MKFYIKDFFSKCDQIHRSHLLKKSLTENIFCTVTHYATKFYGNMYFEFSSNKFRKPFRSSRLQIFFKIGAL